MANAEIFELPPSPFELERTLLPVGSPFEGLLPERRAEGEEDCRRSRSRAGGWDCPGERPVRSRVKLTPHQRARVERCPEGSEAEVALRYGISVGTVLAYRSRYRKRREGRDL